MDIDRIIQVIHYYRKIMKKILCKYLGGSFLYGLETPESDTDIRGVFVYDDPLVLLGFEPEEPEVLQNSENDISLKGINNFIKLLMAGNTEAMECVFGNKESFLELTPEFDEMVRRNPNRFISSEKVFKCLKGYVFNERRLATGERTGLLGRRKEALETYGFSYRNFAHLIRLAFSGIHYFKTGVYPVNLKSFSQEIHELVFSIKTRPDLWTKEKLISMSNEMESELVSSFENRKENFVPDMEHIQKTLCVLNGDVIARMNAINLNTKINNAT